MIQRKHEMRSNSLQSQQKAKVLCAEQRGFLRELGLSKNAIEVYERTLQNGPTTASAVADDVVRYPSAQYRLFYALEEFGLVFRKSGRPRAWLAIEPERAFQHALAHKKSLIEERYAQTQGLEISASNTDVLYGKDALYSAYIRYAEQALSTIDVFAIGVAYSKDLMTTQRKVLARGVRVRHVVQEIMLRNLHIVRTWQRLGVDVRHLPSKRGLHLMIFDESIVIVSFSDPIDTENRLSLVLTNPAQVKMFVAMFQGIWRESSEPG